MMSIDREKVKYQMRHLKIQITILIYQWWCAGSQQWLQQNRDQNIERNPHSDNFKNNFHKSMKLMTI